MFDLSLPKLLILAVLALVVFGPDELPTIAAKAGRALHDLRRIGESAKADLREGLGPEFSDFDLDDLHPRRFAQEDLLSDVNRDDPHRSDVHVMRDPRDRVSAAERHPYDAEATTSSSMPGSSAPSAPVTTAPSSPPATGEAAAVTPAPPPSAAPKPNLDSLRRSSSSETGAAPHTANRTDVMLPLILIDYSNQVTNFSKSS